MRTQTANSAEILDIAKPVLISETIVDYPATEDVNNAHLQHAKSQGDCMVEQHTNVKSSKQERNGSRNADELAATAATTTTTTPNGNGERKCDALPNRLSTSAAPDDQKVKIESDDFFIGTIVSRKTNRNKQHPHAKFGEVLYCVQWCGFNPNADTWEPLGNLTLTHVVDNHERNRLVVTKDSDATIDDWETAQISPGEETGVSPKKLVINHIVDPELDEERHDWRYRIQWWLGHQDSWEVLSKLPRNPLLAYYNCHSLPFPIDTDNAVVG